MKWQQDSWSNRNTNNFTCQSLKIAYKGEGSESKCEGVGEGEGEGVGGL